MIYFWLSPVCNAQLRQLAPISTSHRALHGYVFLFPSKIYGCTFATYTWSPFVSAPLALTNRTRLPVLDSIPWLNNPHSIDCHLMLHTFGHSECSHHSIGHRIIMTPAIKHWFTMNFPFHCIQITLQPRIDRTVVCYSAK